MIYTVTAWQRRASSHLSGTSHAHISTDCKCSSCLCLARSSLARRGLPISTGWGQNHCQHLQPQEQRCSECPLPDIQAPLPPTHSPPAACTTCPLHAPICPYSSLQLGGKLRCVGCTQKSLQLALQHSQALCALVSGCWKDIRGIWWAPRTEHTSPALNNCCPCHLGRLG